MKRLIVMAALCGTPAAYAQPMPQPGLQPDKPALKGDERVLPMVKREPIVRNVSVKVHRVVDGFMVAGQKISAKEKAAYREPIFWPVDKLEKVRGMTVFDGRLWLEYQIPDRELFKRLEKSVGKELLLKVREPTPGRIEVVGIL